MAVGSICVREVDTVRADDTVEVAAERMHQRAVGSLVVVNDGEHVVGIVTDRDLMSRVLAKGLNAANTVISDVMTLSPKTVSEWTPIEAALLIMRAGRFRRIPVVDQDNKLLGLITLDDVLMLLAEQFAQVGRLLKRETPRALMEGPDASPSGIAWLQNESKLGVGD
jgi:CBS domain-containing protein